MSASLAVATSFTQASYMHAILLGLVEGLTEFLPISSTGHLILLIDLLGLATPPGQVFEIVIQLGAILAICWHYRALLVGAVIKAPVDAVSRRFLLSIILAFLPAALLGVLFHEVIKTALFNPAVVASMLIIGGIAILLIERFKPEPLHHHARAINWKLALLIGCCQCLALIPGTSRSGATIMGALLFKVERRAAAEFSFFLAIPTMLGAASYDLYKNYALLTSDGIGLIVVGFMTAFITALLVVRIVLDFITRRGFAPFAWYRIILGSAIWWILLS